MKYILLLISFFVLFVSTASAIAPVADFSSNVTSVAFSLPVSFTDLSSNSPVGWTWYFGDEDLSGPWVELNSSSGWVGRYGHSSVVLPDGSIVLMGGRGSPSPYFYNDSWISMDNGSTWTLVNSSSGWSGRYWHSSVALPDGSIVLMGGIGSGSVRFNDTWISTDSGSTWTELNSSSGWSERFGLSSVSLSDGSIVLMGGSDGSFKNDTWRSTDSGSTWTELNSSSVWSARDLHNSVVLPEDDILLMGGFTGSVRLNDVWRSNDNGLTWEQVTPEAEWSARNVFSSNVLPDGSILLMGGNDGSRLNDIWMSADNGSTWTELNSGSVWSARNTHSSVVLHDGSIVLMGGSDGSNRNDVWSLTTAGSTLQNPSHTYTQVGTYKVTLQAYNSDGYDSIIKIAYITVHGAPVANFTADVTSGIVPLTVSFTDLSTNMPGSWLWDFGDGSTSDVRNATHTYSTAGTYDVTLNATNGAGSNISTQLAYITVNASSSDDQGSSGSDSSRRISVAPSMDPENVSDSDTSMAYVMVGAPVELNMSSGNDPIVSIAFDPKSNEGLVVAKVQVLKDMPSDVPVLQDIVYSFMSISIGTAGTISEDNAEDITIHFKVSSEWVEKNDIDVPTIRMTMYYDGQWDDLPTYQEKEDEDFLYFYAETPGFYLFSIMGDRINEVPEPISVSEPMTEEVEEITEETVEGNKSVIPVFAIVLFLLLVVLAFLVTRKKGQ